MHRCTSHPLIVQISSPPSRTGTAGDKDKRWEYDLFVEQNKGAIQQANEKGKAKFFLVRLPLSPYAPGEMLKHVAQRRFSIIHIFGCIVQRHQLSLADLEKLHSEFRGLPPGSPRAPQKTWEGVRAILSDDKRYKANEVRWSTALRPALLLRSVLIRCLSVPTGARGRLVQEDAKEEWETPSQER
jgi:hypothetical protein